MASIYEMTMGQQFERLHPRIRERFGFDSRDGVASIGTGVMEDVWYPRMGRPSSVRGHFPQYHVPQGGQGIPFSIGNYAYVDSFGRETVTWCRKFKFGNAIRRFDATMIYSPDGGASSTIWEISSIWPWISK